MIKFYKKMIFGVAALAVTLGMVGCAQRVQPISGTNFVLDTVATITIYDSKDKTLIDDTFSLCREYEDMLSAQKDDSDIGRINSAHGADVEVSEDTIELLTTAVHYAELTDGAFDVTIYPVSKLWDFRSGDATVPEEQKIEEALKHVDYHCIEIDPVQKKVHLTDPEAEIDLGGIAKGYIADRLKEFLAGRGVNSAIINLGGNVITIGHNPNGKPFRIGVQKPFGDTNEVLFPVESESSSVVSSGPYERCFEKDGKLYFHILDPATGFPSESELNGVTIVSPDSVDGDALSTSCFVLGPEKGQNLVRAINEEKGLSGTDNEIKAYFIDKNNKVINR
ncbi:thiamine biosynthesis lipoprotein [Lachnospiraceae bacterium]|nr:thiamine biosynthesis lipoprotein [Lachnospiraceae bacterium]